MKKKLGMKIGPKIKKGILEKELKEFTIMWKVIMNNRNKIS